MTKPKKLKWEKLYIADYRITDVYPIIGSLILYGFNPHKKRLTITRNNGLTYVATRFLFLHPEDKSQLYFTVAKQEYSFKWIKSKKQVIKKKAISHGELYLALFNALTDNEFANAKTPNGEKISNVRVIPTLPKKRGKRP